MRHGVNRVHLSRTASHRRSLFANLACALIKDKQIRTTLAKARALRPYIERMITFAKKGDLASRRHVLKYLRQKDLVKELFEKIGPHFTTRSGGYTRIMKLGIRRGDAAPLAIIELVNREALVGEMEESKKEAAKKAGAKKGKKKKAAPEASSPEKS